QRLLKARTWRQLMPVRLSTLANNLEGLAGIAILVGTAYTARYLSAMYASISVKSKAAIAEGAHMAAINASATFYAGK
ncbi:hypothetical protein, partial [Klebsiella pneumoniae]|uniref:hypothetical protein n=1 Tax=Klebsiella pneumoniae TaxID=573 RepID=UPI003B5A2137